MTYDTGTETDKEQLKRGRVVVFQFSFVYKERATFDSMLNLVWPICTGFKLITDAESLKVPDLSPGRI